MSVVAVWDNLRSTQKVFAVIFLLVNMLMLAAVSVTLGYIYTNDDITSKDDITITGKGLFKYHKIHLGPPLDHPSPLVIESDHSANPPPSPFCHAPYAILSSLDPY